MKIAVFGLSADPFHNGHLEIIKRLSNTYDLVVVIPTTIRYYKENKQMFSFTERFETIKENVKDLPNVSVSDIEREVNKDWRFVNSLLAIKELYGKDNEYYLAMGSDSFQKLKTWCNWETIVKEIKRVVVFRRPGYEGNFPEGIDYIYCENMNNPLSSSAIRKTLRDKMKELEDLVFDEMIDDLSFCEGYEEYLDDYHY